ncbi:D-alanyl-lipoteichoic acid acyltransferase DltB (MBOAT superfamily) [Chitinophaga skermanii]|uniref:D-alanyl-lipoteichoic acid acyltransferase DltB (MBOAT superfamily) n=1 Tax=Chitinophaga skermanii TaxID=331697 RepID=A0A327R1B7_9BACT|nr:MBOAT family O-acyltransferase [Chitinophaga skermanii]RAJ10649.1 D-alanyl-lipoteichoic acid acyltransferase DltB (MBOAT superfamily) [Chitinophaga skermanii]
MFDIEKILSHVLYDPKDPVLFNSAFFLYFFAFFLLCYQLVAHNQRGRVWVFTIFSLYLFYKACNEYVLLVILSAIVDFNLSRWINDLKTPWKRKWLLAFSIVINVGVLFYFKYTNFFIGIMNDLSVGHFTPIHVLLPIGISFYTFENLSYTIDVYRKEIKPVTNFMDYLFFLSFFPKLMMGPIVRAADFLPQIYKPYHLTKEDVGRGLFLIMGGLFKKVVISDFIYQNFVQYIFDDPSRHTGIECLMGVYGYALVIYCDFSGYSDMAIGIARWMGFVVPPNFDKPYRSSSITEFWRRWHISLSSWLKDYIYIPLGGNRKGKFRQQVNLMLTMLIGGFWHGANWNFIFWGGMHGGALAVDKVWIKWQKARTFLKTNTVAAKLWKLGGILFTFHFVCFCWIFFESKTFGDSWTLIHQVAFDFQGNLWKDLLTGYTAVFILMAIGYIAHFLPYKVEFKLEKYLEKLPVWASIVVMVAFIWCIIQVKTTEPMIPIYFRF